MAYLSEYVPAATERGPASFPSGVFPESALWNRQMAGGSLGDGGRLRALGSLKVRGMNQTLGGGLGASPGLFVSLSPLSFVHSQLPGSPNTLLLR